MEITAENIFQKTDAGNKALVSRDGGLPFILRRTLIIVDGVANVDTLHNKAPLYDDIEESLGLLLKKGYIAPMNDSAKKMAVKPIVEEKEPAAGAIYTDSTSISTKQRLLHLITVDLGGSDKNFDKESIDKLLDRINKCSNDKASLSEAWKRCIKIINLTIDDEIAIVLKESGQQYLDNFSET